MHPYIVHGRGCNPSQRDTWKHRRQAHSNPALFKSVTIIIYSFLFVYLEIRGKKGNPICKNQEMKANALQTKSYNIEGNLVKCLRIWKLGLRTSKFLYTAQSATIKMAIAIYLPV